MLGRTGRSAIVGEYRVLGLSNHHGHEGLTKYRSQRGQENEILLTS